MTKQQKTARHAAIVQLRNWIKPGDTVWTILRHVSRSGMQREISVVLPYAEVSGYTQLEASGQCTVECECTFGRGEHSDFLANHAPILKLDTLHPNHAIATALGLRQGKHDGLILGGCGMDMGFHLVYELSMALYGRRQCSACGEYMPYDYPTDVTCGTCDGAIVGGYRCLGKGRCPSNYHTNAGYLDGGRAAERFDLIHADGYALRQRWI